MASQTEGQLLEGIDQCKSVLGQSNGPGLKYLCYVRVFQKILKHDLDTLKSDQEMLKHDLEMVKRDPYMLGYCDTGRQTEGKMSLPPCNDDEQEKLMRLAPSAAINVFMTWFGLLVERYMTMNWWLSIANCLGDKWEGVSTQGSCMPIRKKFAPDLVLQMYAEGIAKELQTYLHDIQQALVAWGTNIDDPVIADLCRETAEIPF